MKACLPQISYLAFNNKLQVWWEVKHTSEETVQASEPDSSGVADKLELSDWELRTTLINRLRALVEKDTMPEQMDNVSREMVTPRKNQKEMAEIRNSERETKNVFDGLTWRLHVDKKRAGEV